MLRNRQLHPQVVDSPTLPEHVGVQGDPLERITSPLPSNRVQ